MKVPSGAEYDNEDLDLIRLMNHHNFLRHGEKFKLKSGIESRVYVSGREDLTDNIGFEWLVRQKIARMVWGNSDFKRKAPCPAPCLIGIPTAGNALAQAGAMMSRYLYFQLRNQKFRRELLGLEICHRIMRETLKQHGAHQTWVNGKPDLEKHTYWLVDNVATDGQTKIKAAEKLIQDGYPAYDMPLLIFVDRQQGAVAKLQKAGFKRIIVVYNLLDLTWALGEMNLWPKELVKSVEEEIQAHQFV